MKHLSLYTALIAALIPSGAFAGEAAAQIEKGIGARIVASAPSKAAGFTAILATKDGKQRIFYESADGQYLMYGMMYDRFGNNLTAIDAAALSGNLGPAGAAAQPQDEAQKLAVAKSVLKEAAKANYVSEGKGKVVYVVFDPNCPYCKNVYRKTRALLAGNEIRWIPVGVLTAPIGDSQKKAAAVLRSGQKSLANLEGIKPVEPTQEELAKITQNTRVMQAANTTNVPLVIWENNGKPSHYIGEPMGPLMTTIFRK